MAEKANRISWIHDAFLIGVLGKGVNAVSEIIGGLILFFLNNDKLLKLVITLTQGELSEDPHDKIAQFLLQTGQHLSVGGRIFGAIYLFSHGVIKLYLVWALLKRKLYIYPVAIVVFGLFIIYQLYRYSFNHSPWLIGLSIIDAIVIVLTWLEYRRIRPI